jgi:hypothetical protein
MFCIIAFIAICVHPASAAYDEIFFDGGPYNVVSGSATIDLNNYGTAIVSISVWADAYGYEPDYHPPMNGGYHIDPRVAAEAYVQLGGFGEYNIANEYTYAGVVASGITKNQNGDWIASQVTTYSGTQYNVNLGSGLIDLAAYASANGYASCSVSAGIEY